MSGPQRREQIIGVAVELFAARGFADVTTREIARSAGINEATIYKYFASKGDLFDAVVEHYGKQIGELHKVPDAVPSADLRSTLTVLARNFIEFVGRDQKLMRLMLHSALQDHPFAENMFQGFFSSVLKQVQERVRDEQEAGRADAGIDPFYASISFIGMIVYYNLARNLMFKEAFSSLDDETFIRHAVDIFVKGITGKRGRV